MPDQHPDENGRGAAATQAATPPAAPVHSGRRLRGTAVEVWRSRSGFHDHALHPTIAATPGVWREQAEDALLLGVVEAARRGVVTRELLRDELAALDAWRPTDG